MVESPNLKSSGGHTEKTRGNPRFRPAGTFPMSICGPHRRGQRLPTPDSIGERGILFSFYLLTHAHSQPIPSRQKLPCMSVKPALRH